MPDRILTDYLEPDARVSVTDQADAEMVVQLSIAVSLKRAATALMRLVSLLADRAPDEAAGN